MDKRLSMQEFMDLVEAYEAEQGEAKSTDGMDMTPDEYWKMFAGPEGMKFGDFEAAIRHSNKDIQMRRIK
jgi:hypothetical protein